MPDDDEDVHWALSTAAALWGRGEVQEAVKWLRRAAETASDQNRDQRSLELFKAAAECAAQLEVKPPGVSPAAKSAPSPTTASSAPSPPAGRAAHGGAPAGYPAGSAPPAAPAASRSTAPVHPLVGRTPPPPPARRPAQSGPGAPPMQGAALPGGPSLQGSPPQPHDAGRGGGPSQHGAGPHGASSGRAPLSLGASDAMAPTLPRGARTLLSGPKLPEEAAPHTLAAAGPRPPASGGGGKTLASNSGFEQALARAQALIERGAPPAQIAALVEGAARAGGQQPTAIGLGPGTPVVGAPHAPGGTAPQDQAGGRRPDTAPMPAASRRPDDRAPKSARRGTRSGRRSQSSVTNEAAQQPPLSGDGEVSSTTPVSRAGEPQTTPLGTVNTRRFEDEVTIEHERAPAVIRYDDLDEQTNVLTGSEPGVEIAPISPRRRRSATDPGRTRIMQPSEQRAAALQARSEDALQRSPSSPAPASQPPPSARHGSSPPPSERGDVSRITAFRVAITADGATGSLQLVPLVPNEPPPAGMTIAILVPTDGTSSAQLADLLGRARRRNV